MNSLRKIGLFIWQLPQNIVGLVLLAICKKRIVYQNKWEDGTMFYYVGGFPGGVSLGKYVFLSPMFYMYLDGTENHEHGHCRQSRVLGWFYLLVIGIPSLLHAWWWNRCGHKTGLSYYDFYTEKWADRLGGVER